MSLPYDLDRIKSLITLETAAKTRGAIPERKARKKHCYEKRKEELIRLITDVEELTSKVDSMRHRHDYIPDPEIVAATNRNAQLKLLLHQQRYSLWRFNNIVSDWLIKLTAFVSRNPATNPLAKFIHLTSDKEQRRKHLLALQGPKTADVRRFLTNRSMGYDLLQPYSTEDRFVTADGDYYCTRFDITQFEGVKSVKQVHEALLFYICNMDISISEELGHITLREDYDRLDNRILHQRLVSCDNNGVMHEANAVVFSQFTDCGESDESSGVIATDFVDVDDLFPYRPDTSVRKDVVGAIMLTAIRNPQVSICNKSLVSDNTVELINFSDDGTVEDDEELIVVMRRASFIVFRHSDLLFSDQELRDLRESVVSWNDVMIKAMRDRLTVTSTL